MTYNLGQNKWKTQTLPSPEIKNGKLLVFALRAASSLIWGEGGEGGLLFHFILSRWGLINYRSNLHKETTNWRILVVFENNVIVQLSYWIPICVVLPSQQLRGMQSPKLNIFWDGYLTICQKKVYELRDLSEISRGGGGILNFGFGNTVTYPCNGSEIC